MLENMPLVQHLLVYRKVDSGSIMKWEDYASVHLELLWGSGRCLLIGKTNHDHKSQSFMPTGLSPIRLRLQAFQATKQKDLPTSAAQRAADFNSRGDGGWRGWVGSWGQQIKSNKNIKRIHSAAKPRRRLCKKNCNWQTLRMIALVEEICTGWISRAYGQANNVNLYLSMCKMPAAPPAIWVEGDDGGMRYADFLHILATCFTLFHTCSCKIDIVTSPFVPSKSWR